RQTRRSENHAESHRKSCAPVAPEPRIPPLVESKGPDPWRVSGGIREGSRAKDRARGHRGCRQEHLGEAGCPSSRPRGVVGAETLSEAPLAVRAPPISPL